MARRRLNPRLVKIHRTYTVEEAARLLGTHKHTVRDWIKKGLPTIDQRRPTLIHGRELSDFLVNRRQKRKHPCPPGHMFCVRCRAPKMPTGNMADYVPCTPSSGNLRGICPDCETLMHRRVSFAKLGAVGGGLEITFPQAMPRIGERDIPSVICDLSKRVADHGNA